MGLDLNALAANTATVEFEIMGETGKIEYKPMMVTTERIEAIGVAAEADDDSGPFTQFFIDVITDWDLTYGSKKVPITAPGIKPLPMPLLRAIYLAVLRDAGDGGRGNSSSGISRPQDRKAKSRNGTKSSKQPSTSV